MSSKTVSCYAAIMKIIRALLRLRHLCLSKPDTLLYHRKVLLVHQDINQSAATKLSTIPHETMFYSSTYSLFYCAVISYL